MSYFVCAITKEATCWGTMGMCCYRGRRWTHTGVCGSLQPCATLEPWMRRPHFHNPVCVAVGGWVSLRCAHPLLSPFFETHTWSAVVFFFFDIPKLSHTSGGRRGDKKTKQSNTSSFRGNRKRLKERDSGRRSLGTIKNLTLTGNGSASKKSLTAPAEGQWPCSRALAWGQC